VGNVFYMFLGKRVILFTLTLIAGIVAYCKVVGKGWPMAVTALLWFMAVILLNGTDRIYLNVLSLFTVLFAGIVTQVFSRWLRWWSVNAVLAVGVLALLFATVDHKSLFVQQLPDREIWYYYPSLMSQYESPRVLYLMCHDHGEGVPVHGLPACKYWSMQEGHTPEMVEDQINTVKQHRCDVAFIKAEDTDMAQLLEVNGYHRYDFTDAGLGEKSWNERFIMYSLKPLKTEPNVYPSPTEVLLKRNVVLRR